jgi:hypothetical protein
VGSFTVDGVAYANGANGLTTTTAGVSGQVMTSNGPGVPPSFQNAGSNGLSNVTNDTQAKASIYPNTAPAANQVPVGVSGGGSYAPQTLGSGAFATVKPATAPLTDGATITWTEVAAKAVQNAKVTLGGNRTLAMSGWVDGDTGLLIVKQDSAGGRSLILPAGSVVQSGGGGAVTLSTSANAVDVLTVYYDGANFYWTYSANFN